MLHDLVSLVDVSFHLIDYSILGVQMTVEVLNIPLKTINHRSQILELYITLL